MAPKRRAAAPAPPTQSRPSSARSTSPKTVTVVPPTAANPTIPASKTPSYLQFPLLVILSFSLSAISHTIYHALSGTRLDIVSPDGNPQWQIFATTAFRILELAVNWFNGFDAHDTLSLTLLTKLPHLFLLTTYYALPILPLYSLLLTNLLSTVLPVLLLRPLSPLHPTLLTPPSPDRTTSLTTTALSTLLHALPYTLLTISGLLPTFLATHLSGLKTFEIAHASNLPGIAFLLLPLGLASARFFLPAAASAFSQAESTTYTISSDFDPITASLSQTLHRNILFHLYLPARAREVLRRTVVAAGLVVGSGAFWAWVEVEGTEGVGAMGWAGVWGVGVVLCGGVLGWVGGLLDG